MKSITQWVDDEVRLPVTTPVPGPLVLTAPQRGILQAYEDPSIDQISLMMSSQSGKSMLMLVIVGWHMAEYPVQIMLTQATREAMRRFMTEKLWPLIASNPALVHKVNPKVINTMAPSIVDYLDGMMFTAWSGSSAMMRSATAELVIADEVDIYKPTADYTNPLDMLRQRGVAYGRAFKLVCASTPIDAQESTIEAEYDAGSQNKWHVPCPHCSHAHEIVWDNIRATRLYCPSCGAEIAEDQRLDAIEQGQWVSQGEDRDSRNQSFHLSQLYSPFVPLAETAGKLNPDRTNLRSFTTQILALPYQTTVKAESAADHVDQLFGPWQDFNTAPDAGGHLNPSVITMAVDVQKSRLEYQVIHWAGLLPRVHQHAKIEGGSWDQLWARLGEAVASVGPDMVFIDRGYRTVEVRTAVAHYLERAVRRGRIRLIRGSSSPEYTATGDLVKTRARSRTNPLDLELDTNTGKEMLHDMIVGHGISFNPDLTPADFASQITSEELRMVMRGHREVPRWVKRYSRIPNEALDCAVYNICARYYLGVEYRRPGGGAIEQKLKSLLP